MNTKNYTVDTLPIFAFPGLARLLGVQTTSLMEVALGKEGPTAQLLEDNPEIVRFVHLATEIQVLWNLMGKDQRKRLMTTLGYAPGGEEHPNELFRWILEHRDLDNIDLTHQNVISLCQQGIN